MSKNAKKKKLQVSEKAEEMILISRRHAYDIDVFEILDELRKKILSSGTDEDKKKLQEFDFIQADEDFFINDMVKYGVDLKGSQKNRNYILPSSYNGYYTYLGWKLIIMDVYKIEALLSYQSVLYLGNYYAGKDNFFGLIEYLVYDFVKARILFGENIRLEKIMNWVERNRSFMVGKAYSGNAKRKRVNRKAPSFRTLTMEPAFSNILFEKLAKFFSIDQKQDLFKAIVTGEKIKGICFAGNANSIVEFFKRLRYNQKIFVSNNKVLAIWITDTFCTRDSNSLKKLNPSTVLDVLQRTKNEPTKPNRILPEIAEYISPSKRKNS